ncbi:hypothetical protein D3C86_2148800 [compost metagenome]
MLAFGIDVQSSADAVFVECLVKFDAVRNRNDHVYAGMDEECGRGVFVYVQFIGEQTNLFSGRIFAQ